MSKTREEKVYCPAESWDCPYYKKDGICGMPAEEGCHPRTECEDYMYYSEEDF